MLRGVGIDVCRLYLDGWNGFSHVCGCHGWDVGYDCASLLLTDTWFHKVVVATYWENSPSFLEYDDIRLSRRENHVLQQVLLLSTQASAVPLPDYECLWYCCVLRWCRLCRVSCHSGVLRAVSRGVCVVAPSLLGPVYDFEVPQIVVCKGQVLCL